MNDLETPPPPTAACPEDLARVRELTDLLERERAERIRLQAGAEESRALVHALNNALSVITSFAAALEDDVDSETAIRESIEEIRRAARTAGSLSRKIGDLHRRAPKDPAEDQGRA
jgi:light-regulated signal transduction histidine kinase (bacteriophytochrome)